MSIKPAEKAFHDNEGFWKQSRKWGLENEGPPGKYGPAKEGERYHDLLQAQKWLEKTRIYAFIA